MTKIEAYKFELTCGLLTGLFGVINFLFALLTDSYSAKPLNSIEEFLSAVLVFLGFPMLVAVGSYVHSVKNSMLGILMIAVGAFFSILAVCVILLSLLLSSYTPLALVIILAPNLMAVITLVVSIVEKFNRTEPSSSSTPENLST